MIPVWVQLGTPSTPLVSGQRPIWALLRGYVTTVRAKQTLVFLQAFTDDSASESGDKRLYLAGYLHNAESWAAFSEEWAAELRAHPKIEYLKMAEANVRKGQFAGWTIPDRDEKLRRLIAIIQRFGPLSYEFSVSREQFFRLVKPVAPRALASPHFSCTFGIVSSIARYIHSSGLRMPVRFIFDKQEGVSADIEMMIGYMLKNLPRRFRKFVSGTPRFEDDKRFLPLQAADMLAWHLRREHEDCVAPARLPMADALRNNVVGHLISVLPEESLAYWGRQFQKMPGIDQLQSQRQWQRFRREMTGLLARGYKPPYGSAFKNAVHHLQEYFRRLVRYLSRTRPS